MKAYIWTLPTRLSHWLVFIALVIGYLLGGEEEYINVHVALGYMAGALIVFRIIWGIAGPRYSKFSDFPVRIGKIKEFVINMKATKRKYPGHNPAAALVMIAIMIAIILVVLSGMASLAAEGQGPLAFMNLQEGPDFFEEFHGAMVNILIVLVIVHLTGIIVDTVFHGEAGTLASIFTGYKKVSAENVKLNSFQKIFSLVWIAGVLTLFFLSASSGSLKLKSADIEQTGSEIQESDENESEDD